MYHSVFYLLCNLARAFQKKKGGTGCDTALINITHAPRRAGSHLYFLNDHREKTWLSRAQVLFIDLLFVFTCLIIFEEDFYSMEHACISPQC